MSPLYAPPAVPANIVLNSTTTGSAVAAAAVTEWPGSSRRHRADLTNAKEARVVCRVSSAWGGASVKVAIQYSTDETNWFYLSGTASGSAPVAAEYAAGNAIATAVSSWNALPTAAKADVYLRGVTLDGDNTTSGAGGTLKLEVR